MKERFKELEFGGFKYLVGDNGTIQNKSTNKTLKGIKNKDGYLMVSIGKGELKKRVYVHRLVAMVHMKEFMNNCTVNHKDYNKENNCVDNLECVSREYNAKHSYQRKHKQRGETNNNAKLTSSQVKEIKSIIKTKTNKEIADLFNVGVTTISDIRNEKTWKHIKI